jgi:site-specific DNA recombinase
MRAGLYLRVSTEQQTERYGLDAQRRMLVEFCERQGWDYEIYKDAGISGETLDARPEMLRLLDDARKKKIQVALAAELERFSRSTDLFDWLEIRKILRAAGVKYGTPAQIFDPNDVEDAFLSVLFGALSAREKQKIVERTKRGRVEAARRGRYVSGHAPFGYRKISGGSLAIYESEAQVVRLIFDLLAGGQSIGGIVQELLARKIPSPRGGFWARATVQRILRNPVYGGTAAYQRQKVTRQGRHRHLRSRDRSDWIFVPVPRIVSQDVFSQVENRLRQNAILSRRNLKRFYLLRGLVRCCICGRAMTGKFCGGYRYYTCQASRDRSLGPRCRWHAIAADALETLVWEQITRILRQPDLVLAEARRLRESQVGARDEFSMRLEYVRKALQDLPQERERLQTLYREGYATLEDTKRHLAAIEGKRAKLEDERCMLEDRLADTALGEDQGARLEQVVTRVTQRLERLTELEQFEVTHSFIERIVVGADQGVEVHAYVQAPETIERQGSPFVRTSWQDFSIASMTS